jgi:hypothetical protein
VRAVHRGADALEHRRGDLLGVDPVLPERDDLLQILQLIALRAGRIRACRK